jgi:hypothetical protein
MAILSISYDLYEESGRDYEELISAIKASAPGWSHPVESTWYVDTTLDPHQMYLHLSPHLHPRDKLIITPVAANKGWWSQGMSEDMLGWFKLELR